MGTIIGVECSDGAVLAGDTLRTQDNVVAGTGNEKVFGYDSMAVAAEGPYSGIDEFARKFEAELRQYRTEKEAEAMKIDRFARVASTIAQSADVDVIVSARDEDGVAHIRQVSRDGGILSDPVAAVGSGAEIAIGNLESADRDIGLDEAEELVRETLEVVAERDTETGGEFDVRRVENES